MININDQVLINEYYLNYYDDILRIQKALFIYRNIFVTIDEAAIIWEEYSTSMCAGWLFLPEEAGNIPIQIESQDNFKLWELK